MKKYTIATTLTLALLSNLSAADKGFESIFNGKDLSGWRGNKELWSVKDGAITGVTKADPKLTHNTFLVWESGKLEDFELRLEYRIEKGNSGIQYRSKVLSEGKFGPIVGGYQADFEAGKTYSGILYEERGRGILARRGEKTEIEPGQKPKVTGSVGKSEDIQAKIKNEDWNDYRIVAKGGHLQHFINGVPTVEVTDNDQDKGAKSGVLALQIHVGPPMVVQFRNIRVKHLTKKKADGLESLQGKWKVVRGEHAEGEVDDENFKSISVEIKGNRYTISTAERDESGEFSVDAAASPANMDIVPASGRNAGKTMHAIYSVKGDTMKVCYQESNRPENFSVAGQTGKLLITYHRVRD